MRQLVLAIAVLALLHCTPGFDPPSKVNSVRILAVSAGKRLKASPDLPTMREQGVDMDQTGWWAAMVPAGTPDPIVQKINGWFKQVLSTPETEQFLAKFGGDVFISTPEEGQKLFAKTAEEWKGYVAMAKIPQN